MGVEGAYARRTLPPLARLALVGRLSGVEGTALDRIGGPGAPDQPDRTSSGACWCAGCARH
ncbi:hypothetical protein ACWGIU_30070 [Streptomyces sp. NPDC054840]